MTARSPRNQISKNNRPVNVPDLFQPGALYVDVITYRVLPTPTVPSTAVRVLTLCRDNGAIWLVRGFPDPAIVGDDYLNYSHVRYDMAVELTNPDAMGRLLYFNTENLDYVLRIRVGTDITEERSFSVPVILASSEVITQSQILAYTAQIVQSCIDYGFNPENSMV